MSAASLPGDATCIPVGAEMQGRSIGAYLRQSLHLSARCIHRLKERPMGICVNGQHVTVRYVLQAGDILSLHLVGAGDIPPGVRCTALPYPILYEDDAVLCIAKPAGMPTHPSHGHVGDTLSDALRTAYAQPDMVVHPVNRLDRQTSGVVLFAKTAVAAAHLSRDLAAGRFEKTYLALTGQAPVPPQGRMTDWITREADSIIRRCTAQEGEGDLAVADYVTLGQRPGVALLALRPHTGRTHQLRVQLAARGLPLIGDDLYGGNPAMARQALHAVSLSFPHPIHAGQVHVAAPVPPDMQALWAAPIPVMEEGLFQHA